MCNSAESTPPWPGSSTTSVRNSGADPRSASGAIITADQDTVMDTSSDQSLSQAWPRLRKPICVGTMLFSVFDRTVRVGRMISGTANASSVK